MERVKAILNGKQLTKWLFYGDSITHGAFHTFGWRDYTELFAERVRVELGRVNDVILNTANGGDNSAGLLSGFEWRVAQFKPAVVFIMIGMNDCCDRCVPLDRYEANLHTLADRIAALDGLPVLQTTCPVVPGRASSREPHLPAYMDAVRRVAAARGLPLVDHRAHWESQPASQELWMSDGIHPNEFGHRVLARHLFAVLGIGDANSQMGRLHIP